MINPKKNDQTKIGWVSNKCVITFEKVRILIPIPVNKANKKLPFTCCQAAFNPSFLRVFKTDKFTLLMLSINS